MAVKWYERDLQLPFDQGFDVVNFHGGFRSLAAKFLHGLYIAVLVEFRQGLLSRLRYIDGILCQNA